MNDESPTPFQVVTRHMVMQRDMNPYNHVFGGTMLSWLDEGAALFVQDQIGYEDFVTVAMDDIAFKAPAHLGDHIIIYCRIDRVGRSSICVQTKAVAHEPSTGDQSEIITCRISFVCLKKDRPYRYFESATYEAWVRQRREAGLDTHLPERISAP